MSKVVQVVVQGGSDLIALTDDGDLWRWACDQDKAVFRWERLPLPLTLRSPQHQQPCWGSGKPLSRSGWCVTCGTPLGSRSGTAPEHDKP